MLYCIRFVNNILYLDYDTYLLFMDDFRLKLISIIRINLIKFCMIILKNSFQNPDVEVSPFQYY